MQEINKWLVRRPWVAVLITWWVLTTIGLVVPDVRHGQRERWQADALVFALVIFSAVQVAVLHRMVAKARRELATTPVTGRGVVELARRPEKLLSLSWAFSLTPFLVAVALVPDFAPMWGVWAALLFGGVQVSWYFLRTNRTSTS